MKRILIGFLLLMGGWSPLFAQNFATANLTIAGTAPACLPTACVSLAVNQNTGGATFTNSGTWMGTISFYGSGDGGVTLVALTVYPSNSTTGVTTATGNGTWQVNPAGYTNLYAIFTTATSGTVVATIRSSVASARAGGGGGGGSGTVSGQANGVIPLATASTTIGAQSHMDDGVTTAATITSSEPVTVTGLVTASGGFVASTDGVHPGAITLPCNTTLPALASNAVTILGCPAASNTAWSLQVPTAIPTTNDLFSCVVTSTNCVLTDSGILDTAAGLLAACTGCAPLASPTFTGTVNLPASVLTSATGTNTTPTIGLTGFPTYGFGVDSSGNTFATSNGVYTLYVAGQRPTTGSGGIFAWSSSAGANGSVDTGFSRISSDVAGCGNGTQGDTSCTIQATAFLSKGSTAGFYDLPQGTTSSGVPSCNVATSICHQAPTSVTSYLVNEPGAGAAGLLAGTFSGSTRTENFTGSSAFSTGAVTIGSGSSISAASLCSTTNCPAGNYDIAAYVEITTQCTTTGSYIVWLGWTDDGSAKNGSSTTTFFPFPLNGNGVPTTVGTIVPAAAGNYAQAHIFLHTTGAANNSLGSINYGTTAGACGSGGPMVGKLFLTVTPLS